MNKNLHDVFLKLGISYWLSLDRSINDSDIALDYLTRTIAQAPEEAQAYYFFGQIYKYTELKDKAIEMLKEYLKHEPNSPLRGEIIGEIDSLSKF